MTTKVPWQYAGKKQTMFATTGDQASAGCVPLEELDVPKVSQIVQQLKGGCEVTNSEIIQKVETDHLSEEQAVGRAATEANRAYYQSLADQALANHQEYLRLMEIYQTRLAAFQRPIR
jgi:hypothetical protein